MKDFNYNLYWQARSAEIRSKLFAREEIFAKWIKGGSKVLDAAAGNSFLPSFLKKEKNCAVTVFDISPVIVENQRRLGLEGRVVDLTDSHFDLGEKYDYIVLSEILEHLALPEAVVEKLKQKTDYFVISIPNSAFYRHRLSLLFGRFFKQWAVHPAEHLRYWSHKDFLEWLAVMNLKIVNCAASNGFDLGVKFYKFWPNLLGNQICYLVKT